MGQKLNLPFTPEGTFVNLVLNGNYVGLYWFGEAIKTGDNLVKIDEETDVLLELDDYFDSKQRFRSAIKNFPYNIKNESDITTKRLKEIASEIKKIENRLYDSNGIVKTPLPEDFGKGIDLDSFAGFFIVNEIMRNIDISFMKSCYFIFDGKSKTLFASPIWDFDSCLWENDTVSICKNNLYYDALFSLPAFLETVCEKLDSNAILFDEIASHLDSRTEELKEAATLDSFRWSEHPDVSGHYRGDFFDAVQFLKTALQTRIKYLKTTMNHRE